MVKVATRIERIISRYRKELEKSGIRASGIFLFGSYSRGTHHAGSDIDLVVISEDFSQMGLLARMELLGLAAGRVREPIQAYGFTPQEVEKDAIPSFLSAILKSEAVAV